MDDYEHADVKNEINLLKTLRDKSKYIIKYFDDFPFHAVKHCIVTEYCHVNFTKALSIKLNIYKNSFFYFLKEQRLGKRNRQAPKKWHSNKTA